MGPKIKFSKDQIIDAAFELAKEHGIENVTLRKVAEKLGCSVAPIYVNFKDAEELLSEVEAKSLSIAMDMISIEYTERHFLNIGIGTLKFAREYSKLYNSRNLLEKHHMMRRIDAEQKMIFQMKKDKLLVEFSDEELKEMLLKMSIFTHGLALMAANQLLPEYYDEAMMIELMAKTGEDIIIAAKTKKGADGIENNNC